MHQLTRPSTPVPNAAGVSRRRTGRRLAAAVTVGGLALGALLLAGGTASAKSEVMVTVSTHSLRVGQSVRVTGTGGEDSARYTYLCVDSRTGSGSWHTVSCNSVPYRPATATVRATRRGTEQFRARLLVRRYVGGPLVLDRVSAATTVLIH
ncbi:hypothetical protein ACEZCY_25145 [Streptacidiphilus sp. N1-12]|uniref:Secreted protein n=2 Tax=Streptacidiphilus alkalitolerans TaxID=3342712 RepID=A0ABV6V8R7_9ACTN